MSLEYKLQELPLSEETAQEKLNELGIQGWELLHYYNRSGWFKSSGAGTLQNGSLNAEYDAFGRQRVSLPFTLGDYKHIYGNNYLFLTATGSGADVIYDTNRASVFLTVPSTSGSYVTYQSKMYHNYMPGKSMLILESFVFGNPIEDVTKRVGYFDNLNGIFFEQDATGKLSFVLRSSTSGAATEVRVFQEDWNINTLLTGDFVLDITNTQLFFIDFQWLAVGRVRCGFVHKGIFVLCHVFDHSNVLNVAYMANPNLPIRSEIITQNDTLSDSLEFICATVMSEGGYAETGFASSFSNPTLRAVTSGSSLPVLAIRLKNTVNSLENRAFVRIQDLTVVNDLYNIQYSLIKLPASSSLSGGTWTSYNPESVVEYNIGATGFTNSNNVLISGYVPANAQNPNQANPSIGSRGGVDNKLNFISQNINSTDSEIYVLVAKNLTANSTNVGASLVWKEIF
jgi:hypothetical protein